MPELISGRYQVNDDAPRKIGGFGEVLACLDTLVGEQVAIKVALADRNGQAIAREIEGTFSSILREGAVLSSLRHPGIIRYIDQGEWNGRPYLVLEFLHGQNLHYTGRGPSPLSLLAKVRIIAQAARALEAVHRAGYLHLDIKPENFFLNPDGRVVLLDFGTARRPAEATVPGPGQAVTPAYSAPEQFPQTRYAAPLLTYAADVFAFGVFAFELLSGRHPFGGDDQGVSWRIINEPVRENLTQLVPGIPDDVRLVLSRCLGKVPRSREQSISAVGERLEVWLRLLDGEGVRECSDQLIRAGKPLAAAEEWLRYAEAGSSGEPYHEAAVILEPEVTAAIAARDPEKARALLEQIDSELLNGDLQAHWQELAGKVQALITGTATIPDRVKRCRELRAKRSWRLHDLTLSQILEIDEQHPDVVAYQIEVMEESLRAADDRWEAGEFDEAVTDLRKVEQDYIHLINQSQLAAQSVRGFVRRWQIGARDGFETRSRLGDTEGLQELFQLFRGLLEYDSNFRDGILRTCNQPGLSDTGKADAGKPRSVAEDLQRAIADGKFLDVSDELRSTRKRFPADTLLWDSIASQLWDAQEAARQRDQRTLAAAADIRAKMENAASEGFATARIALAELELTIPGSGLWGEIRKEIEEAERKSRAEAERQAQEEAERKSRAKAERQIREEAERKSRAEAERKIQEEAERKSRAEAERRIREEAELKIRAEAEQKIRKEIELQVRLEAGAELKRKVEADSRVGSTAPAGSEQTKEIVKETKPEGGAPVRRTPLVTAAATGIVTVLVAAWMLWPVKARHYKPFPSITLSTGDAGNQHSAVIAELDSSIVWEAAGDTDKFDLHDEVNGNLRRILVTPKPTAQFQPGHHEYTLRLSAEVQRGKKVQSLIGIGVDSQAGIQLSRASVQFDYLKTNSGKDPLQAQKVEVEGTPSAIRALRAESTEPWIETRLEGKNLIVGLKSVSDLAAGTHEGAVNLVDSGATAPSATLKVALTLKDAGAGRVAPDKSTAQSTGPNVIHVH
jgi:hypothetical protein